ncbi:hypothetical protein A2U01_0117764, partial [Trifolium medium]|nr:hypothetical protein [Trifolium medium]
MATRRYLFARLRSRSALVAKTLIFLPGESLEFLPVIRGHAKFEEESSLQIRM